MTHEGGTTPESIAELLQLAPLPIEGGLFRRTWCSSQRLADGGPVGTAIYALYTDEPDSFSALHRLRDDEVWHHYDGDPLEMLLLYPDGSCEVAVLGHDLRSGQRPQRLVPAGTWMGAAVRPGGRYALIGCTMAPGFRSDSYEGGTREALQQRYPEVADHIARLTRVGMPSGRPPEE